MTNGKQKRLLPWIIGGAVALVLFGAKTVADASTLNYEIEDFRLNISGGTITIGIINPSGSSYQVNAITVDILDNGTRVATASYFGSLVITPTGVTPIQLTLKIDLAGITTLVLGEGEEIIKQGPNAPVMEGKEAHTITMTGSVNVDGIVFPVNSTLTAFKA